MSNAPFMSTSVAAAVNICALYCVVIIHVNKVTFCLLAHK